MEHILSHITQKLESVVATADRDHIFSKRKAISALFPYAILLEQEGHQGMVDVILSAARASHFGKFMWNRTNPYIIPLFDKQSPPSLDRVVALASPHVAWDTMLDGTNAVARWAAATSAVPYTEEVGQSVVDALLQIVSITSLRSHIPIDLWTWLKRRPSLPPVSRGQKLACQPEAIHYIRGLGDIEILKSFFLLMFSEWSYFYDAVYEIETSIREDFSGIQMQEHRKDLRRQLDHVLEQLDRGLEYIKQQKPLMDKIEVGMMKDLYKVLRSALLEVDKEDVNVQACAYPKSIPSGPGINLFELVQEP